MDEQTKRERQAAAVRKLASVFAKADCNSAEPARHAAADERRTLELIAATTGCSPDVKNLTKQRLAQLEEKAAGGGAPSGDAHSVCADVGNTYARMLAADRRMAAAKPAGAAAALRWLVDNHLPGGAAASTAGTGASSALNPALLSAGYWLELSGGTGVHVCGVSPTVASATAATPTALSEPSSGAPFVAAGLVSVAAQRLLPTPHLLWLGSIIALGAAVLVTPGSATTDGRARVSAGEAERVVVGLRSRGYAIAHEPSWGNDGKATLVTVQALIRQLKRNGWPGAFCFVFDEAWGLLCGMWGVAEQVLGPECTLEPSVFAWALDPAAAKLAEQAKKTVTQNAKETKGVTGRGGYIGGNFGLPHRDFSYDEAFGPNSGDETSNPLPRVLSTWMPLTPVRTDNGCMYVVPTEFDPCFDRPQSFSHLRAATAKPDDDDDDSAAVVTECRFELPAARPLAPAEPGDVCMWAGNTIHWGARASPDSEAPPRASIAVTFCRADVSSVHDVSGEQLLTREKAMGLSLAERLSLISRSLLMHQQWYDLDAGLPSDLLKETAKGAPAADSEKTSKESREHSPGNVEREVSNGELLLAKDDGRRWLEAAKAGELNLLQEILVTFTTGGGSAAAILTSQGKGTKYAFTGHTALHWASAKNHLDCVEWLLVEGTKAGVRMVACTNHSDATPLHSAASNGRADATQLLLNAGAETAVKDDCEETALDVATRFDRQEVVALLSKQ